MAFASLRKCSNYSGCKTRNYSTISNSDQVVEQQVDPAIFDKFCNETLESLCEYFEELVEEAPNFKKADVTYGVS